MDARLPAHLEVAALLRCANALGGFGTVIRRGDADGGTILVLTMENGGKACAFERMPTAEGTRQWTLNCRQDIENKTEFDDWLMRRTAQDRDLWVIELDTPLGERLIAESGTIG